MVKNHMKRLVMPTTWNVPRKEKKFITRPKPGGHLQELGISINTFLKELTGTTKTTKESKYLLTKQEIHVNGTRKRSHKHQVGFMDVVTIPSINKSYRVIINLRGKLAAKEIKAEDAKKTLGIIKKKTVMNNKITQITTASGMNILEASDKAKDYKIGSTIVISLPDKKILSHIKLDKGSLAFVFTGKHTGKTGTIEDFQSDTIKIKTKDETFETKKAYIIITGTKKPEIDIEA